MTYSFSLNYTPVHDGLGMFDLPDKDPTCEECGRPSKFVIMVKKKDTFKYHQVCGYHARRWKSIA